MEFALIEDSFPGNFAGGGRHRAWRGRLQPERFPDDCDLSSGESVDLNANLILDECECLGDIDATGSVDFEDLLAVLSVWGKLSCTMRRRPRYRWASWLHGSVAGPLLLGFVQ